MAELRAVGLPIAVSEQIDAVRALEYVDLGRRGDVRVALRTALVKTAAHEHAFDTVFDLFFRPVPPAALAEPGAFVEAVDSEGDGDGGGGRGRGGRGGALAGLDDDALRTLVVDALRTQDTALQRALAAVLVDRHADVQPGRPVAGTYYLYRTMRAIDADRLVTELAAADEIADHGAGRAALGGRLSREHAEAAVQGFRVEVESEIRRRLVEDRGAEAVAKTLRTPLPEDVAFLTASAAQIDLLRESVDPLARVLAARLARKRRHHRSSRPDVRRTMRTALSTGGVPATVAYRPPRPPKPRLVVLADVSGSVSTFAAFTLYLVSALRGAFASVRTFVFVDGVDEVTDLLASEPDLAAATARINREGLGVWLDGHSDYGHALETFEDRWGAEITGRTTVLVLGDARSNYHAPRAEVVGRLRASADQLYWLNPEPAGAWNSGDSVIGGYAPHCDEVVECRTVRQLKAFVDALG
ncbi:VWA domain-containing protein [Cryptosporangium phraense]|uniref:VWA domain-containing protein n=1 Tax=Cryptosporangium phraense TaxID=2593070 RepID=A0A545B061_9ACTN|nr:VWA domain-containing protein [Cryptosporangium phraense]